MKPAVLEARQETFGKAIQANAVVLDNGEYINLYVGSMVPQEFLEEVSAKFPKLYSLLIFIGVGSAIILRLRIDRRVRLQSLYARRRA